MQLSTELSSASNYAFALPSEYVSKEAMYFGILTKKILSGSTVLGFSRSGNYIEKEFLDKKSESYTIPEVEFDDIKEIIKNHAKDLYSQMESIFNQLKQIGLNQIFFVMKILKHAEDYERITTATDVFLIILRGNLAFHNQKSNTGFTQMLKGKESDLNNIFKICKENLQNGSETAGVINGKLTHDGNWISDASGTKIPLDVLTSVGFFDIPPPRYEKLTLTAQHLSFVEFFASVGIVLSSDIEAEFDKIGNPERTHLLTSTGNRRLSERIKAVSIYIWNDLLKFKKSTTSVIFFLLISQY